MAERAQQDTDIVGKAKSCSVAPTENGLTQISPVKLYFLEERL